MYEMPQYQMYGQRRRFPGFNQPNMPGAPPSYMQPGIGNVGGLPGRTIGAPPSYAQPGINDPTLAVGGGGGQQGQVTGRQPPPGAMDIPFQFRGGGMPNWMYAKGWRARRGPDGQTYWFPPGSQQENAPTYALY